MLTRKFARKKDHRTHMLYNLAGSVILYERVQTTEAKAKEIKSLVDKSITLAKKNSLAARRELLGMYFDSNVVAKLFEVLIKRFSDRSSGYTRVIHTGVRHGDGADRAMITLIPEAKVEGPAKPKTATKAKVAKESNDERK